MAQVEKVAGPAGPIKPVVPIPPKSPAQTGVASPPGPAGPSLSLPSEKSVPSKNLGDYTILLYGEKKVGKTSLASMFPDAFFLMFEPGGSGLPIFQRDCPDWPTFIGYLKLLYQNPDRFKTIVIDTVDLAYERCFEQVCKNRGITHPNEERDFGQSWRAIDDEFRAIMTRVLQSGRGVIFTSHATEKTFQEQTGAQYNKIVPTMSRKAREYLTAVVDLMLYYGYYGKERLLTVRGSDSVEAGHRVQGAFRTTTGEHIHSIPMGESEEEAYRNLMNAFQNKQTDPHDPSVSASLKEREAKPVRASR